MTTHFQLLAAFKVLVCVGQEVEKRENQGYNLLLMEILSCLLKGQVSALFSSSFSIGRILFLVPLIHECLR